MCSAELRDRAAWASGPTHLTTASYLVTPKAGQFCSLVFMRTCWQKFRGPVRSTSTLSLPAEISKRNHFDLQSMPLITGTLKPDSKVQVTTEKLARRIRSLACIATFVGGSASVTQDG